MGYDYLHCDSLGLAWGMIIYIVAVYAAWGMIIYIVAVIEMHVLV